MGASMGKHLTALVATVAFSFVGSAFAKDRTGDFSVRPQRPATESSCGVCITYGPPGKPVRHSCCTSGSKSICEWVEAAGGYLDNCICRADASCR